MNAAHWHLVLNHIPVLGTLFGIPFLVIGMIRHKRVLIISSYWVFFIVALLTIPTFLTGDPAEEVIERLPGVSRTLIHDHEEAADPTFVVMLVLGAVALIGLFAERFKEPVRKTTAAVVLILSLVAAGMTAWTANLGGDIRHPEIRKDFVVPPGAGTEQGETD